MNYLIRKWRHLVPAALRKDYFNAFANVCNYVIDPKPRYVHFEITYRCSCKCVFCCRWMKGPERKSEELSTDEIINFLKDAINMGILGISFSGGEPFIRNDIFEIISFCKKNNLFVHVSSNGTLINEKNSGLINELVDSILISIDSIDPATHDSLRGVEGTYSKAVNALSLLDRSKSMVQMVINSENIESLYDYVVEISRLTDRIRFQPIHNNPDNMLELADENLNHIKDIKEKWKTFVDKIQKNGIKLDGTSKYYNLIPEFLADPKALIGKTDCFMGSHAFFMDPYGNVVPCEGIRKPFGNIRENTLNDIWKKARSFRKKYNIKKHRNCACLYSCLEGDIIFWDNFFSIEPTLNKFP